MVELKVGVNPHIVDSVLMFFYGKRISLNEEYYVEYLKLADFLMIDSLTNMLKTEKAVGKFCTVKVENCMEFCQVATLYTLENIDTDKTILANLPDLMMSGELFSICFESLKDILTDETLSYCEMHIKFCFVCFWMKSLDERQKYAGEMMSLLDLQNINPKHIDQCYMAAQSCGLEDKYAKVLDSILKPEVYRKDVLIPFPPTYLSMEEEYVLLGFVPEERNWYIISNNINDDFAESYSPCFCEENKLVSICSDPSRVCCLDINITNPEIISKDIIILEDVRNKSDFKFVVSFFGRLYLIKEESYRLQFSMPKKLVTTIYTVHDETQNEMYVEPKVTISYAVCSVCTTREGRICLLTADGDAIFSYDPCQFRMTSSVQSERNIQGPWTVYWLQAFWKDIKRIKGGNFVRPHKVICCWGFPRWRVSML